MPDLRIWRVKDGRNEGWKDGWIERWLEGRAGYADPRGPGGLALSGDLIRGGPGRKTPPIDFRIWTDNWIYGWTGGSWGGSWRVLGVILGCLGGS